MAAEAVSIKGTKNGLVIVYNPDMGIEELKNTLKAKMEKSKGFFRGAKFVIHNTADGSDLTYVHELERICQQYGLILSHEIALPSEPSKTSRLETTPSKRKKAEVIPIRQQSHEEGDEALLVMRTLRSGQFISSRRSIVILGDVNPGAEVVSEGSIYVLGNCKGSIHAGISGNLLAEVAAFRLQPIVLRIGSIAFHPSPSAISEEPLIARVYRGRIKTEKYYSFPLMHQR